MESLEQSNVCLPASKRDRVSITSLIDSLHPLEIKVLLSMGPSPNGAVSQEQLAQDASLDPSQLSMAVEWLLAKGLISVKAETVTQVVSLTKVGETVSRDLLADRTGAVCRPRCEPDGETADDTRYTSQGGS